MQDPDLLTLSDNHEGAVWNELDLLNEKLRPFEGIGFLIEKDFFIILLSFSWLLLYRTFLFFFNGWLHQVSSWKILRVITKASFRFH